MGAPSKRKQLAGTSSRSGLRQEEIRQQKQISTHTPQPSDPEAPEVVFAFLEFGGGEVLLGFALS